MILKSSLVNLPPNLRFFSEIGKYAFEVVLHADLSPPPMSGDFLYFFGAVIIGVFPLGIIVAKEQVQVRAAAGLGKFHHLQIAIRVASGEDGRPADMQLNIDGFARPVVKGFNQAGLAHQDRAGGSFFPGQHHVGTDDILAGDVVDFLGEETHK